MLTIIFSVLLCFITIILWVHIQKRKYNNLLEHIPGPPPHPLLGNLLDIGFKSSEQLNNLLELQKKYGNVYRLWFGPTTLMLIVADPDFLGQLYNHPSLNYKDFYFNLVINWLGYGLGTSNGAAWKRQRKILNPAFSFRILESFIPIFYKNDIKFIEKLNSLCEENKNICDLRPAINLHALDNIAETSMGISLNAQNNPNHIFIESMRDICRNVIKRVFCFWKQSNILYSLTKSYREDKKYLFHINSFINNVIQNRKQYLKTVEDNFNNAKENEFGIKKPTALIDILLKPKSQEDFFTDEAIRDEVNTFFFASTDTTSSCIFFTLHAIAKYPEIQDKIVEELHPIFEGDKTKEITIHELQKMKYLECVINESLRLYSPVPFIARTAKEDVTYKNLFIPKGTCLITFTIGLHRIPEIHKDPDVFNPDRFLENTFKSKNDFLPFGAGPRICIGNKYAMLEMKSCIARTVYNFKLSLVDPDEPLNICSEVILKSLSKTLFKIEKRDLHK